MLLLLRHSSYLVSERQRSTEVAERVRALQRWDVMREGLQLPARGQRAQLDGKLVRRDSWTASLARHTGSAGERRGGHAVAW